MSYKKTISQEKCLNAEENNKVLFICCINYASRFYFNNMFTFNMLIQHINTQVNNIIL